jgi:hypothetical protein
MAATPKPVRKYAKRLKKAIKKKMPSVGLHEEKKHVKSIAKSHHEKGLITKKGYPKLEKMKSGAWK